MSLTISPEKCTGCQNCTVFCSLHHESVVNFELSRIQVLERYSEHSFLPITCVLCENKPCIEACPEPGAIKIDSLGAVVIDEELCTGCSKCVKACQLGSIRLHMLPGRGKSGKAVVLKCDMCSGDPWCVKVCQPGALQLEKEGTGQEMHDLLLAELRGGEYLPYSLSNKKARIESRNEFPYRGYRGKYLRANLTTGELQVLPLPQEWAESYLGGNGIGTRILWDEVPAEIDPLDEDNKLIVSAGPLCGSPFPNSGRVEFIAKSPLTGIYGDSNAGGHFGPELKFAGYDLIVFEGRSATPVYLYIEDDQLELRSADHLWGMGTISVEEKLKKETGKPDLKTAIIGPAGENLIRYAGIQVTPRRSAARSGLGAVMGAKNLKAIAVKGTGSIPVADPAKVLELSLNYHSAIRSNEFFPGAKLFGTPVIVSLMNYMGRFPTQNHRYGSFDEFELISGEALHENHFVRDLACYSCPIGCDKVYLVREGEFSGSMSTSVEYETLNSLGARVCNQNLPSILKSNYICDNLGLDTISAGSAIAFAMELAELNLLDPKECDEVDLSWGNYQSIIQLLEMISYRRGYLGNLLAEGAARAATMLGEDAARYAMHVKGQDIPSQDGRAQQSMGLAHATSSRGADHLKAFPVADETGHPGGAKKRFGPEFLPEIVDPLETKHKAFLVKDGEDYGAIVDSSGNCKSGGTFVLLELYWKEQCEAINAITGMDIGIDDLKETGERIYNLQRCYNAIHGINRSDDVLPWRMTDIPSPSGHAAGNVCSLQEMLEEYYELRGWDIDTGLPTQQKLSKLGLDDEYQAVRTSIESGVAQKVRSGLGWTRPYTDTVVDEL